MARNGGRRSRRIGGREGGPTWDVGEVMVLVVIPHVEREPVERAVVGVGLLPGLVDEMFCDKMTGHGVHAHA